MSEKNQLLVSCVLYCLLPLFTITYGFDLNHLPTKTSNHRIKRDGGIIAFRPLFVYRQQQKEKQAEWKLKEAQKLQQQLQLQNHQNSIVDYYSKYPLNVGKLDYIYRPASPTYQSYQAIRPYQNNPTIQSYQNYQSYPQNSYEINPTYSSSYNGLFYTNQQDYLFDKYEYGNYQ